MYMKEFPANVPSSARPHKINGIDKNETTGLFNMFLLQELIISTVINIVIRIKHLITINFSLLVLICFIDQNILYDINVCSPADVVEQLV